METTIQISDKLRDVLQTRKISEKESYEKVIWDMIEDTMEISEETKKDITEARLEARQGKVHRWTDIKKELKLNV